tara:strand:+ start:1737 stop:2396 length:660 start_codon:yes stop_codon:yes gene_type:complete
MSTISIHPRVLHKNTLIVLHGMYCDAKTTKEYFKDLIDKMPYTKFIFVESPKMTINWPQGNESNVKSWYNYYTRKDGVLDHDDINIDDMNNQCDILLRIVEKESNLLKDSKKVGICGISQGGTVCLHALMKSNKPLWGVFCLRSVLMVNITTVNPVRQDTPIYIFSGDKDEVYLLKLQKISYIHLEYNGYRIDWHIEQGLNHSDYSDTELKFLYNKLNI